MTLLKHQKSGFYDGTYVYNMVDSTLPLYVPSQCSVRSVEYFLGNIDIYYCFYLSSSSCFTERLYGMIVIAGVNGWAWLVLGCVTIIPQNLLCSLLLGKSHQASLQSESFHQIH